MLFELRQYWSHPGRRDDLVAIMEQEAASDPAYQKIFSSWKAVREESFRWFGSSERAYTEFTIDAV
mgnify:CR=1 FL=1